MYITLIGHGTATKTLCVIARALEKRNVRTKCFFNGDILVLRGNKSLLEASSMLVLGLSRVSREPSEPGHIAEQQIIKRALKAHITCGVVSDVDGDCYASHISQYSAWIDFFIQQGALSCYEGLEMYPEAVPYEFKSVVRESSEVARMICGHLP